MTNRQRRQAKAKAFGRDNGTKPQVRTGKPSKTNWKEHYANKKKQGLCAHCKEKATVGILCLKCWFRNVSSNHFGTRKFGDFLKELLEKQSNECFYSGEKLTPGINASLDHLDPLTRDGSLSLDNVRWVSSKVNRMKTDMTDVEFITMCREIVRRRA